MDITRENINRLIVEAINSVGMDGVYNAALPYVEAFIQEAKTLENFNYERAFAVGGFAAGIDFALRNLEITDDEKGESEK